ncbi:hypothetical protein F5Y07DRAFT_401389 [Xylaria sp. FL0933]|nr:hypothetical protein F5Y07DRAFT_401389 [Xylaria sp. FL0933]
MSDFEYDFWQCGHIISIRDRIQISKNGNLTVSALTNVPLTAIPKRPHGLCPRCHADRLVSRLKDIKTLLSNCIFRRAKKPRSTRATRGSGSKYPKEFLQSEFHTLQLKLEACDSILISDYASVGSKRLRANTARVFVNRILFIGKEAALRAKELGGKDANEAMERRNWRTRLEELGGWRKATLLKDLEARAAELRIVLNGHDRKIGQRYNAETGRST